MKENTQKKNTKKLDFGGWLRDFNFYVESDI